MLRHIWFVLSVMLPMLPMLPTSLAAQAPTTESLGRSLHEFIERGMRDWQIPGLSVAVVRNDSVVFSGGYGVRSLEDGGAVDERTLFGIMSTTKAMTSAAIAMLVDDGAVNWDDPVTKWIPELEMPDPYVTRELTVVDLLTHRAGLGNADLLWVRGDIDEAEIFRRVRLLEPGYSFRAGYTYQNIMYGLAGELIERASGKTFGEFLRQRLWEPLGMSRTFASLSDVRASGDGNVSAPHYEIRDTIRIIEETPVDVLASAGAVWSTASDMARWIKFLLDSATVSGERLIGQSTFNMLFQPHTIIPAHQFYPTVQRTSPHWTTYGLGWFQQDYRGHSVAFHTGSLDGRIAIVGLLPDERFGIVMLGNLDHAEFRHALMLRAFDIQIGDTGRDWNTELLELYGGMAAQGDSARARQEARRHSGTRHTLSLVDYAGTYTHPVWGGLEVVEENGKLTARMGTESQLRGELVHWHYDTFRAHLGDGRSNPSWVRFVIDVDGRVTELRFGDGEGMVFTRAAEAPSSLP
jgi:CubicO group peptidase (beta-lactamase class C family)